MREAASASASCYPLSAAQNGMLFAQLVNPSAPQIDVAECISIQGEVDLVLFDKALKCVVHEIDALRIRLEAGSNGYFQIVQEDSVISHQVVDFTGSSVPEGAALVWIRANLAQAYDLTKTPLWTSALLQLCANKRLWYLRSHHVILDGYGLSLVRRRIAEVYTSLVLGASVREYRCGGLRQSLEEEARYRSSPQFREDEQYWLAHLANPPAAIGLGRGGSRAPGRGKGSTRQTSFVGQQNVQALRSMKLQRGKGVAAIVTASLAAYAYRMTHAEDMIFGLPVTGRVGNETREIPAMMANVLPLRLFVHRGMRASELVNHAAVEIRSSLQHQRYRIEDLRQKLNFLARNESLYCCLLNIMRFYEEMDFGRGRATVRNLSAGIVEDLMILAYERFSEGELQIDFDANLAIYTEEEISAHRERYIRVLEAIIHDPECRIDEIALLGEKERETVLYEWNFTRSARGPEKCIHELFQDQARKRPNSIAVACGTQRLTYAELDKLSTVLSNQLLKSGIAPEERIGLCAERSIEAVIGIVGILKSGAAYVPLDPGYPLDRLEYMVNDSKIKLAVVSTSGFSIMEQAGLRIFRITGKHCIEENAIHRTPDVRQLAYVIYTSGSTGTPKGVGVSHRNLFYSTCARWRYYKSVPQNYLLLQSLSFDSSVAGLFWVLTEGGTLHIPHPEAHHDPRLIAESIAFNKITHLLGIPSFYSQILDSIRGQALCTLQAVIVAGESCPPELIEKHYKTLTRVSLYNEYGPTEGTVWATVHCFEAGLNLDRAPIGKPIANTQMYVLEANMKPAAVGMAGELHIGGMGVARGYLNRPDLTAERFVPDPFSPEPGARMYKTGDVGTWRMDGSIEFLGRNDEQVKIRGYRIELGEIQAKMMEYPDLHEAVVVAREEVPGEKRLVAYYTTGAKADEGQAAIGADNKNIAGRLRAHMLAKLPAYMVPQAFVHMDSLPLTANGKLNRKALPLPDTQAHSACGYEAPKGETEELLAAIWADVLRVGRVGRNHNFFELGGHSLLAMRVLSRVRETLQIEITLAELFARPRLAEFAQALITATRSPLPPITRVAQNVKLKLSLAQQRLWFLAQMRGVSEAYHVPFNVSLKGKLDRESLCRALDRIIERHEVLRTTFVVLDGEPVQRISELKDSHFHLLEDKLEQDGDLERNLDQLVAEEKRIPFDLARGPLIRGRLISLAGDEHVFLLTMHHIVSDAWSMEVLLHELSVLYGAFVSGKPDPLPPLDVQYADYATWQRSWMEGDVLRREEEYWKKTLQQAPPLLELPGDYARPSEKDYLGSFTRIVLEEKFTASLKELSRRHGTTLYIVLLAGWAALMARLSGNDDVIVGTPVANRDLPELERLIGFFVNTLPLRLDLSGEPAVGELLKKVEAQALAGQQHRNIPFERVVELVRPDRSLAHTPLFQVMFAWQSASESKLVLPGLEIRHLEDTSPPGAKFDLTLMLKEDEGRIAGGVEYATSLFEQSTVDRYAQYFRRMLEGMQSNETAVVDRLPILSEAERSRLLYEWNSTALEYPSGKCIHNMFEEQAEKTPGRVAVIYGDQQLTYGELNQWSNRLAYRLRASGVGPDDRVAICIERSLQLIVGVLGVLKAGAAYVPLDPSYPDERILFTMKDSSPPVLLTQPDLLPRFDAIKKGVRVLELTNAPLVSLSEPETNPEGASASLDSECLAYVIYTSGSTGVSKGVAMTHRALVNLLWWQSKANSLFPLRTLQFAALGFDVAFQEIFSTLCFGGVLILMDDIHRHDPVAMARLVAGARVQRLLLPYVALQVFAEGVATMQFQSGNQADWALQEIITAGEQLRIDSKISALFKTLGPCNLQNQYGPTETHVVTSFTLSNQPEQWPMLPAIGRPIANTQIYILDEHLEPAPMGVVGELYIAGAGVARGYLNRAQLTAERFLADPFAKQAGARMYKTGDLGRWRKDGTIEFVGRNDFQVKVRGFRIELGEIEARLAEHAGVGEAVVVAREDEPGDKRLVAYYVRSGDDAGEIEAVDAQALRRYLLERLPEHMVPAAYVEMEKLPLSPNGKLDRKALPAPVGDAYSTDAYEAPTGETETMLAEVWSELLKVGRVGRWDNFFELGGHSLLAVRVISRIRQILDVELPVTDIFAYPVLSRLADQIVTHQLSQFDSEEINRLAKAAV